MVGVGEVGAPCERMQAADATNSLPKMPHSDGRPRSPATRSRSPRRTARTERRRDGRTTQWNPHAAAACWYAGDWTSIVFGIASTTPPRSSIALYPFGFEGGVSVGSGKPVTPWRRMHSEILSVASFTCADGGPLGGPPPGSRWVHFACAAWKAGEAGLIPEARPMRMPPPPLGSGKFGTPFARMHSANLTNPLLSLLDEPGLDEPETFESLAGSPACGDRDRAAESGEPGADKTAARHGLRFTTRRITRL